MIILLISIVTSLNNSPLHGCVSDVAKTFKYCDTTLSIDDRVASFISVLNLTEKLTLLSPDGDLGNTCEDHTAGLERLGLPQWDWLMETNTAVNAACYKEGKCAINFCGPLGLGASFNRTSWRLKGEVFGEEFRAFHNLGWHRNAAKSIVGLTGYGPNINILRDPRFGRASELPGEDPYHSGEYAIQMLQGAQQLKGKYPAMAMLVKHFTAYSRETNRGHDTYDISMYDLWDTYLPQYEAAFTKGKASGAMCSYNAENGAPSCANGYLLNDVIRGKWGMKDAAITTDCGAVGNLLGPPVNAASHELAVSMAINNGTDLEMGGSLFTTYLPNATKMGLIKESAIDESIRRLYRMHFVLGRFDPPEQNPWSSLGEETINSTRHQQIRDEASAQSFVLLKNNGVLPLSQGKNIAVLGPQGMTTDGLLSDYHGDQICFKNNDPCIPTIANSIAEKNNGGKTNIAKGVDVSSSNRDGIQQALDYAKSSDVVVLVMGNDKTQEHEAKDRPDTALPGLQEDFIKQVYALGKPTVLVITNGGALAIDDLIDGAGAIVEAFNPAFGGPQLTDHLFGLQNRWGKMPYTMYPHDYIKQVSMDNYDMSKAPGRTYRYYTGKPLFPFGFGLSLTKINFSASLSTSLQVEVKVSNEGPLDGEEVIMVFVAASDAIRKSVNHPVPLRSLKNFDRVAVKNGAMQSINIQLAEEDFHLVTADGTKKLYPGEYYVIVSNGVKKERFTYHVNQQKRSEY